VRHVPDVRDYDHFFPHRCKSARVRATLLLGLGMNEDELKKNPIFDDYAVRDLNADPTLPFPDNTFDVVTNAVRTLNPKPLTLNP